MVIHDSKVRYNKFTKVQIRVPSRSLIHVKSKSSNDEDNIFAISPPIVKGTSWNLCDLTSHHQGVFNKKRKNWTLALLSQKWQTPTRKIYPKSRPSNQTLLKPLDFRNLDLNKKESWREKTQNKKIIIRPRSPPLTCQYSEGFYWLTNHPKPRVGKLTNDKFDKDVLKCSSEEANRLKIDKDFVQSHWSPWKKK